MIERFEIVDSDSRRPDAERIIFCDGTGGRLLRAETDLELSHWRPNQTPAMLRAGTSTEICFRFLDSPQPGDWTVAVNNHVDVDGILSVYVLLHSQHALAHRRTIVEAAEMGDFWGWGESAAQRVFQAITDVMSRDAPPADSYAESFRRIPGLIAGSDVHAAEIDESLAPLRKGVELVERGQVLRSLIGRRLAHYIIGLELAGDDDARASFIPEFNEAISEKSAIWPHARARWDAQRACLVSTERRTGWYHDLWLPGYLWADTHGLWQVEGLTFHDGMASYTLDNPRLLRAFEEMQRRETARGQWSLGGTRLPFGDELLGRFPLAGRFLNEQGSPAISRLSPEETARAFAVAFDRG